MLGRRVDAAIVGGGFAGVALACRLARAGKTAVVLERRTGVPPAGQRAIFLQPNGLEALEQLSAAGAALERGERTYVIRMLDVGGRELRRYDYRELRHRRPYMVAITPADLYAVLEERLEALGGEPPMTGAELTGLVRARSGAVTGVRYRHDGGEDELAARCVVGADGAASRVRSELGIEPVGLREPEPYVIGIGALPDSLAAEEGIVSCGLDYANGVFRAGDGAYFWDRVTPANREAVEAGDLDGWRATYAERFESAAEVAAPLRSWDDVTVLPARPFRAGRRTATGAVLIGDAAGTVHPQIAQGANLALEDAMSLGDALAALPGGNGQVPDAVLARWARPRERRLRALVAMSLFVARSVDTRNAAWRAWRRAGFALHALGPLRRQLIRITAGLA